MKPGPRPCRAILIPCWTGHGPRPPSADSRRHTRRLLSAFHRHHPYQDHLLDEREWCLCAVINHHDGVMQNFCSDTGGLAWTSAGAGIRLWTAECTVGSLWSGKRCTTKRGLKYRRMTRCARHRSRPIGPSFSAGTRGVRHCAGWPSLPPARRRRGQLVHMRTGMECRPEPRTDPRWRRRSPRPSDLRRAAVSFRLDAGVPVTAIARRAGYSAVVLLRVYVSCTGGSEDTAGQRIAVALEE
jgi:hypothetical protein